MLALPDAAKLANLVSSVTDVICGATFAPANDEERGNSICGRMVMLPIPGPRDIRIVLSCDANDSRTLAAAMRGGAPVEMLTREMIDDAIAEFLNMIAGRIQAELSIEQQLGLPRPTTLGELATEGGVGFEDSILLNSRNLGDLKVWIFEKTAPTAGSKKPSFRSLFKKLKS